MTGWASLHSVIIAMTHVCMFCTLVTIRVRVSSDKFVFSFPSHRLRHRFPKWNPSLALSNYHICNIHFLLHSHCMCSILIACLTFLRIKQLLLIGPNGHYGDSVYVISLSCNRVTKHKRTCNAFCSVVSLIFKCC